MINVKLFAIDTVIIKCFSQNLTEFERLPNPVLAGLYQKLNSVIT